MEIFLLLIALIGPIDPVSNEQMWWDRCPTAIVEEVLDDNTSVYYCEDDPPVVPVDDKWWNREYTDEEYDQIVWEEIRWWTY